MFYVFIQLIIPECDALYCPYEVFKSLVLKIVDTQCIEEPLKSSIQAMERGSNSGNNDHWKDWEIVVLTAGICIAIFAILTIAFFKLNARPESNSPLLNERK